MKSLLARDNGLSLHTAGDALEVVSSGLPACIFTPAELHPEFFALENGLAGDVFQKFSNYRFRVGIVLADDHGYGERITELVRDHRRHHCVRFFPTIEEALAWLS